MYNKVDFFFSPKDVFGGVWNLAVEFILLALSRLPWCCLCSSVLNLCYCCCSFVFRITWKPSSYAHAWFWGKTISILDLVKVSSVISWKIEVQQSCKLCTWLWGWSSLIIFFNCIGVSVVRWQLFDWFYSLTLFRSVWLAVKHDL